MAEATQDDIFNRLAAGEQAIARLEERTDMAIQGVEKNREHFDQQLEQLWRTTNKTNRELGVVSGQLTGIGKSAKWGFTILGFLITTGLAVLGLVLS